MKRYLSFLVLLAVLVVSGCGGNNNSMEVTATAYVTQPGGRALAAWGDTLKPGMKAIAVSRDLIDKGLTHGVKVSIEGLSGKYTVLDKMNKKWTKKIDIYMGHDLEKARAWGKKTVTIRW